PRIRGLAALRSSILGTLVSHIRRPRGGQRLKRGGTDSVVLMLSVGVTASSDSVTPAPKPARSVRGPVSLPSASASIRLYWSKATQPVRPSAPYSPPQCSLGRRRGGRTDASLGRVANDERRAACIPLAAERRPRQLLAL